MKTLNKIALIALALNVTVACSKNKFQDDPVADQSEMSLIMSRSVSRTAVDVNQASTSNLPKQSGEYTCLFREKATGKVIKGEVLKAERDASVSLLVNGKAYEVNHSNEDGTGIVITALTADSANLANSKLERLVQFDGKQLGLMDGDLYLSCDLKNLCNSFVKDYSGEFQKLQLGMVMPKQGENPLLNKYATGMHEAVIAAIINNSGEKFMAIARRDAQAGVAPTQQPPYVTTSFARLSTNVIQLDDATMTITCKQ